MANLVGTSLFERFLEGDQHALGLLFDRLRPYIRVIIQGATRDSEFSAADQSDLIQDVLVQALKSIRSFEGNSPGELVRWVRTIAIRVAQQSLARSAQRPAAVRAVDGLSVFSRKGGPATTLMEQERAAQVALTLARLPDEMRQLLIYRIFDDLSHDEIAGRMHRSPGAIRVMFFRAMQRFREICRELNDDAL